MLVNLHTAVIGLRPRLDLSLLAGRDASGAAHPATREVWFEGGFRPTPVCRREALPPALEGPAIIEQLDCTTVVEPGNRVSVDRFGNLLVEI